MQRTVNPDAFHVLGNRSRIGGGRGCKTSSLIEQVIPPRDEFLISTKSVHNASEPSTGLFRTPFRMNLGPTKPYAVIKGIGWLEK
jgi:hypothetical protein